MKIFDSSAIIAIFGELNCPQIVDELLKLGHTLAVTSSIANEELLEKNTLEQIKQLSSKNKIKIIKSNSKEETVDFQKSLFYKSDIAENQGCLVSVGLQIKAAKFSSISPLKLTFEKPIVCKKGQVAVVLKPESTTIRILGSGTIQ